MTNESLTLLEKCAYIMVILVCFTILMTFFSYIIFFLLMLRRKMFRSRTEEEHNDQFLNFICCDTSGSANDNYSKATTTSIQNDSNNTRNQTKPFSILNKCNQPYEQDREENNYKIESKAELTNTENSYMPKLINNIKSMFTSFSTDSAANKNEITDLTHIKTVIIPAEINTSSSDESLKHVSSASNKNNLRRASTIKLNNRKTRNYRNSSVPNTKIHVKFNANTKKGSDDDDSYTSDDYPSSIPSSLANKKSISSQDSRKYSSGSSYYQSSIVDLYRQQRLSNASLITSNSNVRKLSINQLNPFVESGVKLITLQQQDKLTDERKKKMSVNSIFGSDSGSQVISKLNVLNMRRFSVMTTADVSEKFWVPAEIAAQKQRSSLPNTAELNYIKNTKLNFSQQQQADNSSK